MTIKPAPPSMQSLPHGRNGMPSTSKALMEPVSKTLFGTLPPLPAGHVYVISSRDGNLRTFSSSPVRRDLRGAQSCFRIDITERTDDRFCTLRSSVDAYTFSVILGAAWQVTDPEAAVLAGPATGDSTVLDILEQEAWRIARRFSPQQPAQAENAIGDHCSGLVLGSCGLKIARAWARFTSDSRVAGAVVGVDEERYKAEVVRERLRVLTVIFGPGAKPSVLLHLAQHPEDTASVLTAEAAQTEQDRAGFFALLDRLLSNNFLNDADAQALRDRVLAGPTAFGSSSPAGTATGPSVTMVPIPRQKPPLSLPAGLYDGDPDGDGPGGDARGASLSSDNITWEPIQRRGQENT